MEDWNSIVSNYSLVNKKKGGVNCFQGAKICQVSQASVEITESRVLKGRSGVISPCLTDVIKRAASLCSECT